LYRGGTYTEFQADGCEIERLRDDETIERIEILWEYEERYPGWEDDACFDRDEEEIRWRFRNGVY
jgi:Mn-dependent DtxR family transcriptional regulator